MANVTNVFMTAADGAVQASYTYDDQSLLIGSAQLVNNSTRGTLTIDLRDPNTQAFLLGPLSRSFGTGTFNVNVSAKSWFMTPEQVTFKDGSTHTLLVPPFLIDVAWSQA